VAWHELSVLERVRPLPAWLFFDDRRLIDVSDPRCDCSASRYPPVRRPAAAGTVQQTAPRALL
jgi:hypothetical protein